MKIVDHQAARDYRPQGVYLAFIASCSLILLYSVDKDYINSVKINIYFLMKIFTVELMEGGSVFHFNGVLGFWGAPFSETWSG